MMASAPHRWSGRRCVHMEYAPGYHTRRFEGVMLSSLKEGITNGRAEVDFHVIDCNRNGGRQLRASVSARHRTGVAPPLDYRQTAGTQTEPSVYVGVQPAPTLISHTGPSGMHWGLNHVVGLLLAATLALVGMSIIYLTKALAPFLKAAESAMREMERAAEEMQDCADEMEKMAEMFQADLPPALEAMEDSAREVEELSESLKVLIGPLTNVNVRPAVKRKQALRVYKAQMEIAAVAPDGAPDKISSLASQKNRITVPGEETHIDSERSIQDLFPSWGKVDVTIVTKALTPFFHNWKLRVQELSSEIQRKGSSASQAIASSAPTVLISNLGSPGGVESVASNGDFMAGRQPTLQEWGTELNREGGSSRRDTPAARMGFVTSFRLNPVESQASVSTEQYGGNARDDEASSAPAATPAGSAYSWIGTTDDTGSESSRGGREVSSSRDGVTSTAYEAFQAAKARREDAEARTLMAAAWTAMATGAPLSDVLRENVGDDLEFLHSRHFGGTEFADTSETDRMMDDISITQSDPGESDDSSSDHDVGHGTGKTEDASLAGVEPGLQRDVNLKVSSQSLHVKEAVTGLESSAREVAMSAVDGTSVIRDIISSLKSVRSFRKIGTSPRFW